MTCDPYRELAENNSSFEKLKEELLERLLNLPTKAWNKTIDGKPKCETISTFLNGVPVAITKPTTGYSFSLTVNGIAIIPSVRYKLRGRKLEEIWDSYTSKKANEEADKENALKLEAMKLAIHGPPSRPIVPTRPAVQGYKTKVFLWKERNKTFLWVVAYVACFFLGALIRQLFLW